MDWMFVVVFLVLLWPAIQLLRVFLVAKIVLGLRLGGTTVESLAPSAIPPFLLQAAQGELGRLGQLGFRLRQGLRTVSPAGPGFEKLALDLAHPTEPIRALVHPHEASTRSGECWIGFLTLRVDGPSLFTAAHAETEVGDGASDLDIEVHFGADPAVLLNRHRERVAAVQRQGAWLIDANNRAIVLHHQWRLAGAVEQLLARGVVAPNGDGTVSWKFFAAFRASFQALLAEHRRKKVAGAALKHVSTNLLSAEAQNEFDWRQYLHLKALQSGRLSGRAKALLGLISVAAFAGWLAWSMSPAAAISLLVAIFVHELGHLAGMWLFGHRDTQMLFLPFFGAAAIAHDRQPLAPWKELVILFLGPLPGLALGLVGLVWFAGLAPWVRDASLMFIVLNALNLAPVLPLDGGRIFDTAFANRFPRLRVGFVAVSGAFLVLGWFVGMGLLAGLGVLMLLRLGHEWRTARTVVEIRAEGSEGADEEPVVRRLLQRMREADWAKVPMPQKITASQHLQILLRQPLPGFGAIALAVALFVSPLVLLVGLGLAKGFHGALTQRRSTVTTTETATPSAWAERPPVAAVAPADNAAIPLAEALAAYARIAEADSATATNATPEQAAARLKPEIERIVGLLRQAAQRPRFVPAPDATPKAFDPWLRNVVVNQLGEAVAEKVRADQAPAAAELLRDYCALLGTLESDPYWWTQTSHGAALTLLHEITEEWSARGLPMDSATREALLARFDEPRLFAFARVAIPAEHLASARLTSQLFDDAAKNSETRGGGLLWKLLSATTRPGPGDIAQEKRMAKQLAEAVERAAGGTWPKEPTEAEMEREDAMDRFRLYSELSEFGSVLARLRQARAALAVWATRAELGRMPRDFTEVKATWWTSAPAHPMTNLPLRWVRRDGKSILTFAPEKPDPTVDAETAADRNGPEWRLPPAS